MMSDVLQVQLIQADYEGYPGTLRSLPAKFRDYPRTVSIETQVRCNAKCSFCPCATSDRKGQEMGDVLFEKIVRDLSDIPARHKFGLTLARINEPLLDRRLERFSKMLRDAVPGATHQFWSNGTLLKEGCFEWMAEFKNATLSVSLNSMDEEEHTAMMGFGLSVVLRGLDYLHGLVAGGRFPLRVTLCGPFSTELAALRFQQACGERWPLFRVASRPFFRWAGKSKAGAEQRINFGLPSAAAQQAGRLRLRTMVRSAHSGQRIHDQVLH